MIHKRLSVLILYFITSSASHGLPGNTAQRSLAAHRIDIEGQSDSSSSRQRSDSEERDPAPSYVRDEIKSEGKQRVWSDLNLVLDKTDLSTKFFTLVLSIFASYFSFSRITWDLSLDSIQQQLVPHKFPKEAVALVISVSILLRILACFQPIFQNQTFTRQWTWREHPRTLSKMALRLLLFVGLGEELLHRHFFWNEGDVIQNVANVFFFGVPWHILTALVTQRVGWATNSIKIFLTKDFMLDATLLGAVCAGLRHYTGTFTMPALYHAVVVIIQQTTDLNGAVNLLMPWRDHIDTTAPKDFITTSTSESEEREAHTEEDANFPGDVQ